MKSIIEQRIDALEDSIQSVENSIENIEATISIPTLVGTYFRKKMFTVGPTDTSITIPSGMQVVIGSNAYSLITDITVNIPSDITVDIRKGKDLYVYACAPESGTEPVFVISNNSTVPTGYTADNSRKIGGFHCLCADAGTAYYNQVAGNILKPSCWDLLHRPISEPEGMVYFEPADMWLDIYLASWDGSKLVSKYGAVIADGASTKKFHGELFNEELSKIKKFLPPRDVFANAAIGSTENLAITGAADPNTTGGHTFSNGARIISYCGLEDCIGVLWQWSELIGAGGSSGWNDSVYNSEVDSVKRGQSYGTLYRLLVGGDWNDGASCGSRCVILDVASGGVAASVGARGASHNSKLQLIV